VAIAILGLGLIGGSLGMALKKAGEGPVVGCATRPRTLALARERGAIDVARDSPEAAVEGAELVILAAPIRAIPALMGRIAPHLLPGAVVTDTASTKARVMAWASASLPGPFVGGHPMAGKEAWGIEAASADLFKGAPYILVPGKGATKRALERLTALAHSVGAKAVVIEDPEEHDRLVGGISHLPLFLSVALTLTASRHPDWPRLAELASGGFRDATRLAFGNPEMGRDIFMTNKRWALYWLDRFLEQAEELRVHLEQDSLEEALAQARQARERWLKQRYG
jgi:prephenate dehydrogenase